MSLVHVCVYKIWSPYHLHVYILSGSCLGQVPFFMNVKYSGEDNYKKVMRPSMEITYWQKKKRENRRQIKVKSCSCFVNDRVNTTEKLKMPEIYQSPCLLLSLRFED